MVIRQGLTGFSLLLCSAQARYCLKAQQPDIILTLPPETGLALISCASKRPLLSTGFVKELWRACGQLWSTAACDSGSSGSKGKAAQIFSSAAQSLGYLQQKQCWSRKDLLRRRRNSPAVWCTQRSGCSAGGVAGNEKTNQGQTSQREWVTGITSFSCGAPKKTT